MHFNLHIAIDGKLGFLEDYAELMESSATIWLADAIKAATSKLK